MAGEGVIDIARRMLSGRERTTVSTTDGTGEDQAADQVQRSFHEIAFKRFHTVESAEQELRTNQEEDQKWRAGGSYQWDEQTRSDRIQHSRPVLTINRFPEAINQVVNGARQARGGIQVNPVDNGADLDTAETLQGIIRHIEDRSDADAVYIKAAEHQATIGRGFWRVVTERVSERSFDYEIKLKQVRNPFMIYCDPSASEPDRRDIRFAFVVLDLPTDAYTAKYGEEAMASLTRFQTTGDGEPNWEPEGHVRVAEYFYVEETKDRLLQLTTTDPAVYELIQQTAPALLEPILESDLPKEWKGQMPAGLTIIEELETMRRQVKWALIDAEKILEGNEDKTAGRDWDGKWIPIVQVLGEELDIDGKVDFRGVVRDGKDPQRVYNYEVTSLVETIQLGRTAPWVGYRGQFKGHEKKWRTANTRNHPYLEVEPVIANGQIAPLPQRVVQEPPIMAITRAIAQADNDFKSATRWHDASLGERGPQESGVAIANRQRQDESANAHFPDNMNRSKKFTGDILVDLIPKTYDTLRIMKILGSDDERITVMVHAGNVPDGFNPEEKPDGIDGIFDISMGTYDVTVNVGQSFQTRRQETADNLARLFDKNPAMFEIFADIYFENLDSPVAHRLAKRAKKMLPQQFQDSEGGEQPSPEQIQEQNQELTKALEEATQQLQAAQQEIATDGVKAQAQVEIKREETQSRERIAKLQAEVKLADTRLRALGAEALEETRAPLAEQLERLRVLLETDKALTTIQAESQATMQEATHEALLEPAMRPPEPPQRGTV